MRWPEPNCPQDPPLLRKWSPLLTWQPIRKGSASLSAARQNLYNAAQLSPQVHQDLADPRPHTKTASCSWTSETWAAHGCILFSFGCINKQTTLKLSGWKQLCTSESTSLRGSPGQKWEAVELGDSTGVHPSSQQQILWLMRVPHLPAG